MSVVRALPDASRHLTPVPIFLDRNSLDVDSGGGLVLVIQRLLRFEEAAGLLSYDPREGVSGLVQMDVREPGLFGVPLQILDERP